MTKQLTSTIGAEVIDLDRDRLLHDSGLPDAILDALEEYGVLLFREVGVDDDEQVAFGRRLGNLVARQGHLIPEITVITQGPDNHLAEYLQGNLQWHIDGAQDDVPCKAGILSARVMAAGDGSTEFASTYAAYDDLTEEDRQRLAELRVVHMLEATLRRVYPDPTPEQLARWSRQGPAREHPLVWKHRSGRRSLVVGSTPTTCSAWTRTKAAPCSPTCLHEPPVPSASCGTTGPSATWSCGTTPALSTV